MISVVFDLSGNFFIYEFFLLVFFLIISLILMYGVLASKGWAWKGLLVFFEINMVNQLMIYFRTFVLMDVALPLMACFLGFVIALMRSE
jgi:hypothetical protein